MYVHSSLEEQKFISLQMEWSDYLHAYFIAPFVFRLYPMNMLFIALLLRGCFDKFIVKVWISQNQQNIILVSRCLSSQHILDHSRSENLRYSFLH